VNYLQGLKYVGVTSAVMGVCVVVALGCTYYSPFVFVWFCVALVLTGAFFAGAL
jgi:hypothetical protein